ncbi:MAG: hypothetical protein K2Q03_02780 [Sphingobacteriaceae bacterium]|nr:hypothetical protein [Sphingobacteriaceae bacterium]
MTKNHIKEKDVIEFMEFAPKYFKEEFKSLRENLINDLINMSEGEMIKLGMRGIAKKSALSHLFQSISTEGKATDLYEKLKLIYKCMTDKELDCIGRLSGVADKHLCIHRAILRNEDNDFTNTINSFQDTLQEGDIILMCGNSISSASLLMYQRCFSYAKAKSSHVAIVHADFICIDAMPDIGVTNRLVSEILSNAVDGWRVIRFRNLQNEDRHNIQLRCTYYLNQPYKIIPKYSSNKHTSYCSELARKVYADSKIAGTNISKNMLIKPCDFDKLIDTDGNWEDVTDKVMPFIKFCIEHESICKHISKLFISGLQLNYSRSIERQCALKHIKIQLNKGKISNDEANREIKKINEIEYKMNHVFWKNKDKDKSE